jgi:hypothetical protein
MSALRPTSVISPLIAGTAWQRLRIVFALVALAALASAASGLWRTAGEVGQPFGGFAWTLGYRDRYWVFPTTPYGWPAIEGEMRPLDVILSAEGQPPSAMAQVFSELAGGRVVYEVERRGRTLAVAAPVTIFSWIDYWELYGTFVMSGLSALIAALVLLNRTRERAVVLL